MGIQIINYNLPNLQFTALYGSILQKENTGQLPVKSSLHHITGRETPVGVMPQFVAASSEN